MSMNNWDIQLLITTDAARELRELVFRELVGGEGKYNSDTDTLHLLYSELTHEISRKTGV